MDWSLDRHLQARMALTLVALAVLTVALGAGVAVGIGFLLTLGTGVFDLSLSWTTATVVGVPVTLVAGAVVLRRTLADPPAEAFDADEVDASEYPLLHATVTRVAQAADLPVPAIHVAERETPLAMTTGLRTDGAQLVVSTGLLDVLDTQELEAVVAHELAHVKNRDAAVMTLVELPLSSARTLGATLRSSAGVHPVLLAGSAATYVVWGAGRTLVASLSRSRELAADRGATALLGDPSALASALDTLADDVSAAPETDARERGLAALSVVPSPRGDPGPALTYEKRRPILWSLRLPVRRFRRRLNVRVLRPLLATHPATDERVERLREFTRSS